MRLMEYETRRANFAALITKRFGESQARAAQDLGLTQGRISQLIDPLQPFGEKAARSIEEKLSLPRGWLDRPTELNVVVPAPAPSGAQQVSLEHALPVVLDALAQAHDKGKLRTALQALLDDDAPAYRQRVAELLAQPAAEPRKRTGTDDR